MLPIGQLVHLGDLLKAVMYPSYIVKCALSCLNNWRSFATWIVKLGPI